MTGKLKKEIRQKRPFSGIQEEAILSIMRTSDLVGMRMNEVLRSAGLSLSQYNALRILRGSHPDALSCGEISERMVRRDPDLTRLLDRLEARGLVVRTRGLPDRRVVRTSISSEGLEVLKSLDAPVEESVKAALAHVPVGKLRTLVDILEEIRETPGE